MFFPALTDSFSPSTDSSLPSTDSSPLAFLLLEPSPYKQNTHLSITFLLLYVFLLSNFIWNTDFFFQIKKLPNGIMNIFSPNTVDTHLRHVPPHFIATGCRLWTTGSGGARQVLKTPCWRANSNSCCTNLSDWICYGMFIMIWLMIFHKKKKKKKKLRP